MTVPAASGTANTVDVCCFGSPERRLSSGSVTTSAPPVSTTAAPKADGRAGRQKQQQQTRQDRTSVPIGTIGQGQYGENEGAREREKSTHLLRRMPRRRCWCWGPVLQPRGVCSTMAPTEREPVPRAPGGVAWRRTSSQIASASQPTNKFELRYRLIECRVPAR